MGAVVIKPLPAFYHRFRMSLRPCPEPVFPGGSATAEDLAQARELFVELDDESRAWYRYNMPRLFGDVE